jgi:hypothetical protein
VITITDAIHFTSTEIIAMLSSSVPQHRSPNDSWFNVLQAKVQAWIRQEIIDEDPYDEERLAAQALYEQLQQMEQSLSQVVSMTVEASHALR